MTHSGDTFFLQSSSDTTIALIQCHDLPRRSIQVTLLENSVQGREPGKTYRLEGPLFTTLQPILTLHDPRSDRTVFQVSDPKREALLQHGVHVTIGDSGSRRIVQMESPLTIFIAFAVSIAIDTTLHQRA